MPPATPPPSPGSMWLDLLAPTGEDIARVSRECGLNVPTREALQEIEASSRLRADTHALYLSMPLAIEAETASGLRPEPLGFILTPKLLVTIRYGEVPSLKQARERLQHEPATDSGAAFATVIESIVDAGADKLETLSAKLASLSPRVFRSPDADRPHDKRFTRTLRDTLRNVGLIGDDLSLLRETLLGLQRIIGFATERAIGGLPEDTATRLRIAGTDIASLIDFELHLTNKTQFLLDAILGFISTEQNDIFKLLTIFSVAGIPPTLIASMYGMNFHAMPELSWHLGYPFAIVLIVLSTLLPILWFKRRGWW